MTRNRNILIIQASRVVFWKSAKIHFPDFRGSLGVFGSGNHEHILNMEKSLQLTIEGVQVNFPESFNIAVPENRRSGL